MRTTALLAMAATASAISLQPMESGGPGPDLERLGRVTGATHLRNVDTRTGRAGFLNATERPSDPPEAVARDQLLLRGLGRNWAVVSNYKTERKHGPVVHHVTLRQSVGGLECSNCLAVASIDARGRVINFAYTAHLGEIPPLTPVVTPLEALTAVLELWDGHVPPGTHSTDKTATHATFPAHTGLSPEDVQIDLRVISLDHAEAQLTWRVFIHTEVPWYHQYEAWVQAGVALGPFGAEKPSVVRVTDQVNWDMWGIPDPNRAEPVVRGPRYQQPRLGGGTRRGLQKARSPGGKYEVYTIPDLDPGMGPRHTYEYGDEPLELVASPLGWHSQGDNKTFTTTVGNNVCAQENQGNSFSRSCDDSIGFRPDGGAELDFVFGFDEQGDPRDQPTLSAAVTNLFWWHNVVHDIFQLGGFDEPAGNFQESNMGLGGLGDDAVQANAQDGAGFNNANFATPADGQRPRCRMYLWNAFSPHRDGDFESGIIIHEIGHGISNRLTGGPNVVGCLSGGQSGGMGEGWSDWWAIALQQRQAFAPDTVFPMGDYVVAGGIRVYPYTFDMSVNPTTFGYLADSRFTGVHAIGSVWCQILMDAFWLMKEGFGWNTDWYALAAGDAQSGNGALWQDVLDGLKLQPCGPTFVDARDAILLADELNYDGRHACTLWCAFARRGLGTGASVSGPTDRSPVESFAAPAQCACAEMVAKVEARFGA